MVPRKESQSGETVRNSFLMYKYSRCSSRRRRRGVRTQDEGPQVRLQALELISVILQLFLCDPPGVIVRIVHDSLLLQPL